MRKISINVYTLSGIEQHYEIDILTPIKEFIKKIICTHKDYSDKKKFNPHLVDLINTRLIHCGKTLDHQKTFQDYKEFLYKSNNPYKMHIVPRGGTIDENIDHISNLVNEFNIDEQEKILRSSSPISIRNSSESKIRNDRHLNIRSCSSSNSYSGSNSFLENQINRIDQRQRTDLLQQACELLNDISKYMKELYETNPTENSEKLEKILQSLSCIDGKLEQIIDNNTPVNSID